MTSDAEWRDVARAMLDDLMRTLRAPEGALSRSRRRRRSGRRGRVLHVDARRDRCRPRRPRRRGRSRGTMASRHPATSTVGRCSTSCATPAEVARRSRHRRISRDGARRRGAPRLLTARAARPAPLVDTKILSGWNGLAISAFARAGAILADPRYVRVAREAADFILAHMRTDGRFCASMRDGSAGQPAFLEDYAFLAAGLLDLYEATFELRWLDAAERDARRSWRTSSGIRSPGGYFDTGHERDPGLPRTKPADDGADAIGQRRLRRRISCVSPCSGTTNRRDGARRDVACLGRDLTRQPDRCPRLLGVVEAMLDRPREVVLVEPATGGAETGGAPWRSWQARYLPNRALVVTREGEALAAAQRALPFVGEKHGDRRTYDGLRLRAGRCLAPTSDPAVLARQLDTVHSAARIEANGD